ncbi:hypothetical protein ACLOJK_007435 [Asimina triloba]
MPGWLKILLAVLPAVVISGLLILFLLRLCSSRRRRNFPEPEEERKESFPPGIAKLHVSDYNSSASRGRLGLHAHHALHLHSISEKRKPNYYLVRRGVLAKPLFSWGDHPWLVSEAVENGWPIFAFTSFSPSSLPRSATTTLWDFCAGCDYGGDGEAEMSWEVGSGSADSMQKIRLNSGLKKIKSNNPKDFSYVRTALPLPGPSLGNSSFPQVAYFEITISSGEDDADICSAEGGRNSAEGELAKLIREKPTPKAQSDAAISPPKAEESKSEGGLVTLGLAGGAAPPFALPGSYRGSVGFNSNGCVSLDGMFSRTPLFLFCSWVKNLLMFLGSVPGITLAWETKKNEWRLGNRVIGCGFDPGRKKVFFTIDAELVHTIDCKSEEFSSPLYPTLASNVDVTVLVNLGQSAFRYRPANAQRTPNPCFLRPDAPASRAIGYEEDSKEFFSMGRIDSQWLQAKKSAGTSTVNNSGSLTIDTATDLESEADLFEIVIDGESGSTPTATIPK